MNKTLDLRVIVVRPFSLVKDINIEILIIVIRQIDNGFVFYTLNITSSGVNRHPLYKVLGVIYRLLYLS